MPQSLAEIPLTRIDGQPAKLADYRGKVLLVVNVASQCGLTPQYAGLQSLYQRKRAQGLEVLGFPANNFGAQEPGTNAEIATFCETNFGVEFPMFAKISVAGRDRHPLYDALIAAQPKATGDKASGSEISWNFEKFVVGRDGAVIARFSPDTAPDDARLVKTLDEALAR
jgi:glutathione peroxidase